MEDLRAYQLSYCMVCQHRKIDWRSKVLCGLTNEFADFKKDCEFFSLDFDKHNSLKDSKRFEIEQDYDQYLNNDKAFELIDIIEKVDFKDLRETHNIKIRKNLDVPYLICLLLPVLFIWQYFSSREEIANNTLGNIAIVSFYLIPLLFIALLIYIYINFNKVEFKTDEKGFVFRNKRYFWNEILIIVKLTLPARGGSDFKSVILGTKSRGIIELKLSDTNIKQERLIEIILLNRDLVLQKSQYLVNKGELGK